MPYLMFQLMASIKWSINRRRALRLDEMRGTYFFGGIIEWSFSGVRRLVQWRGIGFGKIIGAYFSIMPTRGHQL